MSSENNLADLPSRGCNVSRLIDSEWWSGPQWLYKIETEWPTIQRNVNEKEVSTELNKCSLIQMINNSCNFKASDIFSSYTQLIPFLAWLNRFLSNCRASIDAREVSGIVFQRERNFAVKQRNSYV